MAAPTRTAPNGNGGPGSGVGVSGLASAQAEPRPNPQQVAATQDGPTAHELHAAWEAYQGHFADGQDDGPLGSQPGVPNLNILSNRIKPIVNTGVDFLFGPNLPLSLADRAASSDADRPGAVTTVRVSKAAKQAQALVDATFGDDDQRMTLFSKLAVNGGVYGHVFVKIVEPRRGAPSLANPPRLIPLNPETVSVFTDPEDADLVTRYRIEYATTAADGRTPIRRRQDITRVDPDGDDATTAAGMDSDTTWFVQNFEATGMSGGQFKPIDKGVEWPYALPPIVDWQNYPNPNSHWGQRDVTDSLVALNNQLRLVESNINTIGFLQGHPILYSVGADTGGIKPTPGRIIDLQAPDSKIDKVDASGNLDQLMNFAEQLRSDMDEESGIPGVATGRMETLPRGQISGITMRLLYAPAITRTEHKRRLYGQGIRQICQTVLAVCGVDAETIANLDVQLGWQDALPSDDLAMAQTAATLAQIGYSQHTLIERTGGDPDVEAQWLAEEGAQKMAAVMQGKALPPMPAPTGGPTSAGKQPQPQEGEENAPLGSASAPPTNHPAAIAARQQMKNAAKGVGQSKGARGGTPR